VGRDHTEIERTVGGKVVIRDTEAEARRVLEDLMEHNRTPMGNIEDDDTFWVGTANEMIERFLAYREAGFDTVLVEMPAPYDPETMERLVEVVRPGVESAG
jgi:alkanesulfonate monooxygenase SsuD/methylene tetrahydromethanopterin reductase-like flavin-dependent oxidoreductase (luciferase family)